MKLLMWGVFCGAVALVTCESSSDHGTLSEMREEFAQMKADISELKTENAEMKAENAEIKAKLNATTAGKLEFFVDGRTVCPDGTIEVNATKGRVLLGKPDGGKTGAVYNRPLDAGEVGRSPPHSHAVTVNDPGHTHVGIVEDPGHRHSAPPRGPGGGSKPEGFVEGYLDSSPNPRPVTDTNKTGISIENLPAKSAVSISVDANDAGEHLPLVYVLICQKVA
jgi:hypothetical protein